MTKFESYLKERNIPIDSLEANSIQEGMQWVINEARKWLFKNTFKSFDGSRVHTTFTNPADMIEDFRKYMEE